jgi:hypothetical protein
MLKKNTILTMIGIVTSYLAVALGYYGMMQYNNTHQIWVLPEGNFWLISFIIWILLILGIIGAIISN